MIKIENEKKNLGVSILMDGTLLYFGGRLHSEAFKNDVEDTEKYKKLNIQLDDSLQVKEQFFNKIMAIAAQGVITICDAGIMKLVFSPSSISKEQADAFRSIRNDYIKDGVIVTVALVDEAGKHTECSLDEYMEIINENSKQLVRK